jgi:hypothetical protein
MTTMEDVLGAPQCRHPSCTADAVIAGKWCPGHAFAVVMREPARPVRTSFGPRTPSRICTAGYGCQYPAVGEAGLCTRHARQMVRRGRTTPIAQRRPLGAASARDAEGRKQCASCVAWYPVSDYGSSPVSVDGLQGSCKHCRRLTSYSLSQERYAAILDAQEAACAVCREPDATGRDLAVDHDHRCCPGPRSCGKCVRGLLCGRCNLGLGRLGDSPERLHAVRRYLRHWDAQPARVAPIDPPKPRGRRWSKFRLTDGEYAHMLETQGGRCALCPRLPGRRSLAVDHDHRCCPTTPTCGGCVRGLLCTNCNVGLSHFDEDEERLVRAENYLMGDLIVCT